LIITCLRQTADTSALRNNYEDTRYEINGLVTISHIA
jgi:hypothetical protein